MYTNLTTNQNELPTTTIGVFISITACGSPLLVDGAAVLKHSIYLTSVHGNLGGRYDYKFHAIYHPNAKECVQALEDLGYQLEERDTPVAVQDIQGEWLRTRIVNNGCCGEKELIKLEAYTFTQYRIVVHVDIDSIFLKPLDPLFDVMLDDSGELRKAAGNLLPNITRVRYPPDVPIPTKIDAFFTRDCKILVDKLKLDCLLCCYFSLSF